MIGNQLWVGLNGLYLPILAVWIPLYAFLIFKNEFGVKEVITLAADLGQGEELGPIQQKALDAGVMESLVVNVTETFVTDYAFPAIKANASV